MLFLLSRMVYALSIMSYLPGRGERVRERYRGSERQRQRDWGLYIYFVFIYFAQARRRVYCTRCWTQALEWVSQREQAVLFLKEKWRLSLGWETALYQPATLPQCGEQKPDWCPELASTPCELTLGSHSSTALFNTNNFSLSAQWNKQRKSVKCSFSSYFIHAIIQNSHHNNTSICNGQEAYYINH